MGPNTGAKHRTLNQLGHSRTYAAAIVTGGEICGVNHRVLATKQYIPPLGSMMSAFCTKYTILSGVA